jgi:AcrR family transcriptional regulator
MRKTAVELLGIPDPPRTGRDRLVLHAIELFYTHGFNAVGIDRIIDAAGVTKTTFYKHFDSKDDLMVAAVKQRDAWEAAAWGRAIHAAAGDDPRARLLALFDVLDEWFNAPDFRGCIFINTAAEFPNPHDPIHQAAASYKRRCRDNWRDAAKAAGAEANDAETFADQYALLVEGTLIMRQVHGRNDAARVARGMVQPLVDRFFAERVTA